MGLYTETEAATIRKFVRERQQERKLALAALLDAARRDCAAIVAMIARDHVPARIYQWGSLVHDNHFSQMSDIDLALEGITDPGKLSAIIASAEKLTRFPLDLLAIEHLHPAYAEHIRKRGRVVYER
jgi:predicted nucleotidyltransferase